MRPIGEEEFLKRWEGQYAEWCAIRDELIAAKADSTDPGEFCGVSAWDVSAEQRKRRLARGDTFVTVGEDGAFFELTPGEDLEKAKLASA